MNVIKARGLVRYYGSTRGVDKLDLNIPQGSVTGLLGLNGSGKTTAIKLLLGHLLPNSGTVTVWDQDPAELSPSLRSRIAYVADQAALPLWMSLQEGMELYASYFPSWDASRARELLKQFELPMERRYAALSKGQQRRFFLFLALAQQPELLVLDEPAGGLDTVIRREFLDLLADLAQTREVTVLLSSHILSDVERIMDHVAFIHEGRSILQEDFNVVRDQTKRLEGRNATAENYIRNHFTVLTEHVGSTGTQFIVNDFAESKVSDVECTVEHVDLEDIFLAYHGTAQAPTDVL